MNGTDRIIGYIEAKRPTKERLDLIEGTDQFQRYRSTFPNLILINFLGFLRYVNDDHVETVVFCHPVVLNKLGMVPPLESKEGVFALHWRATLAQKGLLGSGPTREYAVEEINIFYREIGGNILPISGIFAT